MRVDIWSDVVCPWCYVGKARFEKALAGSGTADEAEVVYRSFELDPSWPAGQTMPILDTLASKYRMSPMDAAAAEGQVARLARDEGLGFRTDRELGNTFDVHRVLQLGRVQGFQHKLLDGIYRAYFAEAQPIFEPATLASVAADAGLDPADVQQTLDGEDFADAVRDDERQARELGISGVPFFVFDGRLGVSGAQPVATFVEALRQAANPPT
jgi:predicted DsbA family dithiol-disulfide isomerase